MVDGMIGDDDDGDVVVIQITKDKYTAITIVADAAAMQTIVR